MEQATRVLIEEAQTDTVGLWAVLWQVREEMPSLTSDEAKQATLAVVRGAIGGEHIVPGEFADQDEDTMVFVPWRLSATESMARIEREWASLGRDPNPGEVVWFVDPALLPLVGRKHPMGRDWKP